MTEAYLGEIQAFSFSVIPSGWMLCDGRELQIMSYQALYSLLGVNYGGNGSTTFRIPDLRSRVPMGYGVGSPGYSYTIGTYGGIDGVVLNNGNLPPHVHNLVADATNGGTALPNGNYFAKNITSGTDTTPQNLYAPASAGAAVPLNAASVSTVGGGAAHSNIQPSLALAYCIATQGYYPMRP